MSDELARVYRRLGRVEDKLDRVLELLSKLAPVPPGQAPCPHCRASNDVRRRHCGACGKWLSPVPPSPTATG